MLMTSDRESRIKTPAITPHLNIPRRFPTLTQQQSNPGHFIKAMSSISKVSINDLTAEHREAFIRALHIVLLSQPTRRALAQVVDGIPTRTDSNGWEFVKAGLKRKNDPSEESTETVKSFQDNFEIDTLEIPSDVCSRSVHALYTSGLTIV